MLPVASLRAIVEVKTGPANASLAKFDASIKASAAAANAATTQISRAAERSAASWAAAGTQMSAAGKTMTRGVTLPVAAIAAVSAKMAVDFEKSMRNVNSIAQLPERQFKRLNKQLLDMAGPTAQAPKTLAEGLYDLVSSGFDAKESLTVLHASAQAATAGLTTTEVSTKAVAAALNAYHRPARDAKQISDDLFQTVNLGVVTFDELASTIGYVLPAAATMGVNLKEIGASISTLTKGGQSSSNAVTNINAAITSFIKPSKDMHGLLKLLGYETSEQLVKQKGFQGAIEEVTSAVHGDKEAIGELFPNVRAMRAVFSLTGEGARSAAKDLRGFKDDAGITAKVLHEQEKSRAFQLQKLKAEASTLAIELGNDLLPVIGDIAHDVAGLVHTFSELSPGTQEAIIKVAALAAAIGPLLRILGFLSTTWGRVLIAANSFEVMLAGQTATAARTATSNAALSASYVELSASIRAAAAAQGAFTATQSGLLVPGSVTPGGAKGRLARILNRGAMGVGIGLGGMAVGGVVGGNAGNFISGASAGAAAGSLFGLPGAAVGGAIGGTVANVQSLIDEVKRASAPQRKLADSSREVVAWFHKQREATRGLSVANSKVAQATTHAKDSARALKQAEQHLTTIRQRFGPLSRQALHAEYELARARHRNEQNLGRLQHAEKLQGTSLAQYKAVTRSTIAEEKHRIALLKGRTEGLADLFKKEQVAGGSQKRLAEVGRKGLTVTAELKDEQGKLASTLEDASQKAGKKWASNMKSMSTAMLAFGRRIPGLEPKLSKLGNHPGPKRLSAAFDDMDQRIARLMGNQKRVMDRAGGSYADMATVGSEALLRLGSDTNNFARAFGAPTVKFSVTTGGGDAKVKRQLGGPIELATGGLAGIVPGVSTGDNHLLSINGVPVAKVESREGIFVGNRNLMGALAEANAAVPRFQKGGGIGPEPQMSGPQPLAGMGQGAMHHGYKAAQHYLAKHTQGGLRETGSVGSHPELQPGISAIAATVLKRWPGLVITSTTGGGHAENSLHYSGRAVDLGGSASTMLNAAGWIKQRLFRSLAEGIHNPNLSVADGQKVGPGYWGSATWADHVDHIHLGKQRGGLIELARGGHLGDLFQQKARRVWAVAAPLYGRSPSAPMPTTRLGVADPHQGGEAHRYEDGSRAVGIARWNARDFMAGRNWAEGTLLHEWAHYFQRKPKTRWEREGGAEAFERWAAPQVYGSLGLPFKNASRPNYPGFVGRVLKEKGRPWVQKSQFLQRGGMVAIPHLSTGGPVPSKSGELVGASYYGGPTDGTSGTVGKAGVSLPGTQSFAELAMGQALGGLPMHTKLKISRAGKSVIAEKLDIGSGGDDVNGKNRAIDLWYETANAIDMPETAVVRVASIDGSTLPGHKADPPMAKQVKGDYTIHKAGATSRAGGTFGAKVKGNYKVTTSKLTFGALPTNLHACTKELRQLQRDLGEYRAAARQEKDPETKHALELNVRLLEHRVGALRKQQQRLLQEKRSKEAVAKLVKAAEFESWNAPHTGVLAKRQAAYELAQQFAEQVIGTEPEEPAAGTTTSWVDSTLAPYVEGQETPAFASVLGKEAGWRNSLIQAGEFATGKITDWRGQINKLHKRIAEVQDLRKTNPKAFAKLAPQIPGMKAKVKALRGSIQKTRTEVIPGWDEQLSQVQGLGGNNEILGTLPSSPEAGKFGGYIWDTQTTMRDLGLKLTQARAGIAEGGAKGEREGLLEDLLRQANQRLAVRAVGQHTIRGFPYAGAYAAGGIVSALVGERGPELATFPSGTRIHSADDTRQMLGPGDITFVVNGDIVQESGDTRDPVEAVLNDRRFPLEVQKAVRDTRGIGAAAAHGARR